MVLKLRSKTLRLTEKDNLQAVITGFKTTIESITTQYNGRIVRHEANTFLSSFDSVTEAVHCGIAVMNVYHNAKTPDLELKIGISAGTPVTERDSIFEDTIKSADYLSDVAKGNFSVTRVVKDLFEGENQNKPLANKNINVLNSVEEDFIRQLMGYTGKIWSQTKINVGDFEENLGFSKSKLYRTMMDLVGKSPNIFLRDYRLSKALDLLQKQNSNISEIAYETGFNSPAYFSKCFHKKYGILPSSFISNK
jgi:AraC-like DNA-binding protein